jgi:hypothetical protein
MNIYLNGLEQENTKCIPGDSYLDEIDRARKLARSLAHSEWPSLLGKEATYENETAIIEFAMRSDAPDDAIFRIMHECHPRVTWVVLRRPHMSEDLVSRLVNSPSTVVRRGVATRSGLSAEAMSLLLAMEDEEVDRALASKPRPRHVVNALLDRYAAEPSVFQVGFVELARSRALTEDDWGRIDFARFQDRYLHTILLYIPTTYTQTINTIKTAISESEQFTTTNRMVNESRLQRMLSIAERTGRVPELWEVTDECNHVGTGSRDIIEIECNASQSLPSAKDMRAQVLARPEVKAEIARAAEQIQCAAAGGEISVRFDSLSRVVQDELASQGFVLVAADGGGCQVTW